MTCIVGLVDPDGCVWIGGDSAGTSDNGLQTIRNDKKVFLLNSPDEPDYKEKSPTIVVGGTTSYRVLDLLLCELVVPPYHHQHPKKYLVTDFVNAIRACLKKAGYEKKDEGEEQGGEILLGWQGRLFHIFEDYQVGEASIGYDAVGGGTSVALGAMFATHHLNMLPEERIRLALQAATYHCRSVRPPFLIEHVASKEADSTAESRSTHTPEILISQSI
jgi:hypothetical protein